MWYNGGGDTNSSINSTMNSVMDSTMGITPNFMNMNMSMTQNFNDNNHDVFDFSLHSSSMQQGTESASTVVPVSISNRFK